MPTRSDVNPDRRYPVVVGRSWSMPGVAAERKLASDTRAAVIEYLTEYAGQTAEVAVRAAELIIGDRLRQAGVRTVALTADELAAYARLATGEA